MTVVSRSRLLIEPFGEMRQSLEQVLAVMVLTSGSIFIPAAANVDAGLCGSATKHRWPLASAALPDTSSASDDHS
jgi:hypothetical protein